MKNLKTDGYTTCSMHTFLDFICIYSVYQNIPVIVDNVSSGGIWCLILHVTLTIIWTNHTSQLKEYAQALC